MPNVRWRCGCRAHGCDRRSGSGDSRPQGHRTIRPYRCRINNAGISLFSRFEETPPDAFRRVIETNLFGYVYGARIALRRFRDQGYGLLINNASIVAEVSQPYTSAYVDAPRIRVCAAASYF